MPTADLGLGRQLLLDDHRPVPVRLPDVQTFAAGALGEHLVVLGLGPRAVEDLQVDQRAGGH